MLMYFSHNNRLVLGATICSNYVNSECIYFVDGIDAKMETVLGEMEVELDGRFCCVRNTETNLGIFLLVYCVFDK